MTHLKQAENTGHSPVDNLTKRQDTDIFRSKVRPYVTYLVVIGYLASICYAIFWFLNNGKVESALALISNLSAVAATIVGFWFGSRTPLAPQQGTQGTTSTSSSGEINLANVQNVITNQGKTLLQLAQALGLDTAEELTVLLKKPQRLTQEQRAMITRLTGLNSI